MVDCSHRTFWAPGLSDHTSIHALLCLLFPFSISSNTTISWILSLHFSRQFASKLVGALSPVNHKGLHQGWTQTSLYLQVIHFTGHSTTSHAFWAYLYSAGTQHGDLHPRAYTGTSVSHSQHRKRKKNSGEVLEKECRWVDRKVNNKQGRNLWQ